jgi:phosphoglycerol transferase
MSEGLPSVHRSWPAIARASFRSALEPGRLRALAKPLGIYLGTSLLVTVTWCLYQEKWPGTPGFSVPLQYEADAMAMLGVFKGFAELPLPWDLRVDRLNAPFGASWNDFPHSEKLLYYFAGVLNRLFEAGVAANLAMLWAHISAALAFLWVARRWKIDLVIAVAASLVFAFSPYMMWRSLAHINLAYIWPLPLILYLVLELARIEEKPAVRSGIGAALVVLGAAFQHPYYPMLLLQLLVLATLQAWLRGRRAAARFGAVLVAIGAAAFIANESNVLLYAWRHGENRSFAGRSLEEMMRWGLRLPDLFLPVRHPVEAWRDFAYSHYFDAGNTITENHMAFLGFLGCGLFLALLVASVMQGFRRRLAEVPGEAWVILYVLFFSLVGGLDYMLGALGFTWLRCANRYSIVVLCLLLFWGCRALQQLSSPKGRTALAIGLGAVSMLEAFEIRLEPAIREEQRGRFTRMATSDRSFARELERKLVRGSALFQLPVMGFPEAGAIHQMLDYEHFRPFLWSEFSRFSYGAHRGRPREGWQRFVETLDPAEMVDYLERHGFSGLVINRRGFEDRAASLEKALRGQGVELALESKAKDLVAYSLELRGSERPDDYASIALDDGWWGWETGPGGRWSWSKGPASMRVIASPGPRKVYELSFDVESHRARHLRVVARGRTMASVGLNPGGLHRVVFRIGQKAPETLVELITDQPPERTQEGDPRPIAFRMINPEIAEVGVRGKRAGPRQRED